MFKQIKPIPRERMKWTEEELNFLKVVGNNIIRIKKEKKITSKHIYEALDMDKSNYRRIEVGNTNISLLLLKRIAKILDVTIDDLTN